MRAAAAGRSAGKLELERARDAERFRRARGSWSTTCCAAGGGRHAAVREDRVQAFAAVRRRRSRCGAAPRSRAVSTPLLSSPCRSMATSKRARRADGPQRRRAPAPPPPRRAAGGPAASRGCRRARPRRAPGCRAGPPPRGASTTQVRRACGRAACRAAATGSACTTSPSDESLTRRRCSSDRGEPASRSARRCGDERRGSQWSLGSPTMATWPPTARTVAASGTESAV